MNRDSENLARLLVHIQKIYTETTNAWERLGIPKINLKNTGIDRVEYGNALYNNILAYVDFLTTSMLALKVEEAQGCGTVRTRIKALNSIEEKIHAYTEKAKKEGNFPIIKCLNDLFGARTVLEDELTTEQIKTIAANALGEKKCKVLPRSVGSYKATHVYFHSSNANYDWELQVWNAADEQTNLESHKEYKQRYTIWEKEHKEEGGTTNGEALHSIE